MMKEFSSYISLWEVVALKAALLPTDIWEIPEHLKISATVRKRKENTTLGRATPKYGLIKVNMSSIPQSFHCVCTVFPLTNHFL